LSFAISIFIPDYTHKKLKIDWNVDICGYFCGYQTTKRKTKAPAEVQLALIERTPLEDVWGNVLVFTEKSQIEKPLLQKPPQWNILSEIAFHDSLGDSLEI
jgi:hypothetical protein